MTTNKLGFTPIYYDSEFTRLCSKGALISIALVIDPDHYFYAEFNDYEEKDKDFVPDDFMKDCVLKHLKYDTDCKEIYQYQDYGYTVDMRGSSDEIKEELTKWLEDNAVKNSTTFQIYSDCLSYDWVFFVDLLCGNSLNLPKYIYYIPYDLSSVMQVKGIDPDINREKFVSDRYEIHGEEKHNALWDASIIQRCFDIIEHSIIVR